MEDFTGGVSTESYTDTFMQSLKKRPMPKADSPPVHVRVERHGQDDGYSVNFNYNKINFTERVATAQDVWRKIASLSSRRADFGWPEKLQYSLEVHLYKGDERDEENEEALNGFLRNKLKGLISFVN
ncbi:hypothetical protein HYT24_00905 [Candidatus Pacearchaeota archaeon]|nr:hypothetical protein [Candidatus Pacearchaeota archaeon]